MEKLSPSGSSSHRSRNRAKERVTGIPKSCWCGVGIVEKIFKSDDNSYRHYYRYLFAYSHKLRNDPHVFKCVDEAFFNEIEQLDYQVSVLEKEMMSSKARGNQTGSSQRDDPLDYVAEDVLNEFEMYVLGNVEDAMVEALRKMNKMMELVFGSCVVVVVLGLVLNK